jgi:hypothetical protein
VEAHTGNQSARQKVGHLASKMALAGSSSGSIAVATFESSKSPTSSKNMTKRAPRSIAWSTGG